MRLLLLAFMGLIACADDWSGFDAGSEMDGGTRVGCGACTIEESCYECNGTYSCRALPISCENGVRCEYPTHILTCGTETKCVNRGDNDACCGELFCDLPNQCEICDGQPVCLAPGVPCP